MDDPGGSETVRFKVSIDERNGEPHRWPGYSTMRTRLVGRLPLANGATVCAVWHPENATFGGRHTFPISDADRARLDELEANGTGRMMLFGQSQDGSVWIFDGPTEKRLS